ncbi:Ig-like domain-containing protein [Comamonas sediminis]|uniref:Ig-like domain-containing protein n=1 Tax=Comamonas sediminis TaxID=1783360 RepID=UPI003D26F89B
MLKRLTKIAIFVAASSCAQLALAARQCLALPGTYGAVTVTGCENDPANGIYNPVGAILGAGYPYDGLALGQVYQPLTCTYGFSHSIATSSITIDLDIINPADKFTVELDGQPYVFVPTDIVQTPLPGGASSTELIAVESGAVLNAPSTSSSSGTVRLSSTAPARISTLKLNMDASGGGGVTRVCIDDAAEVVPPSLANDEITVSRTQPTVINVISNDEAGVALDSTYPLTLSNIAAGALAYSGGQIQFTPASGFTTPVTFQYQACSAASVCAIATVTLTPQAIAPTVPTPVPMLGGVGLLLLSGVVAGSMVYMRRRKSI